VAFTAIPAGVSANGNLRIAILVSPKLEGGSPLGPFANWPENARDLRFHVRLGKMGPRTEVNTAYIALHRIVPLGANGAGALGYQPDLLEQGQALYATLFAGCSVKGFDPPPNTTFKVYDAAAVRSCLQNIRQSYFKTGRFLTDIQSLARSVSEVITALSVPDQSAIANSPNPVPGQANDTWNMVRDHIPAVPRATAASAANNPDSTLLQSLPDNVRATALRDAARVWNNASELKNETMEDLAKSAKRQSNPIDYRRLTDAERKLHNPLAPLRAYWQRRPRSDSGIKSDLAQSIARDEKSYRDGYDFHKRWALLGHHSGLFPMLGMRLEVQFPRPADLTNFDSVSVEVAGVAAGAGFPGNPDLKVDYPWTAFEKTTFWPAPLNSSAMVAGFLNVADSDYYLETEDLDHSGQATLQSLENIYAKYKAADNFTISMIKGADVYPAAPKTLGITLIKRFRDADLAQLVDRARRAARLDPGHENPADWVWFAEDLVRGIVADVWAQDPQGNASRWFSLCRRHERILLKGEVILDNPNAEGSIKPPAIEENEKINGVMPERYISEALFSWNGTHLCAPSSKYSAEKIAHSGQFPHDVQLWQEFRVEIGEPDGPQAPLLFLGQYWMRVRAEFLTGDKPAPSHDAPPVGLPVIGQPYVAASAPLVFRRLEPLGLPSVLLTAGTGSDDGNYRALRNVILSSRDSGSTDSTMRVLAPPRISRELAELHMGKSRKYELTEGFGRLELNRDNGSLPAVAERQRNRPDVPYLPDPLAAEAIFTIYDRVRGGMVGPVTIPFYKDPAKDWPNGLAHVLEFGKSDSDQFKIERLSSPPVSAIPGVTRDSSVVRIGIPKGYHGTLRILSGFGSEERLKAMELWHRMQIVDANPILKSGHPLLTPELTIELKHAVQRPMQPAGPNLPKCRDFPTTRKHADFMLEREFGVNVYAQTHTFSIDRKSTAKIQVTVESPSAPEGQPIRQSLRLVAAALEVKTDEEILYTKHDSEEVPLRIDPGSPQYYRIALKSRVFSRFSSELGLASEDSVLESSSDAIDFVNVAVLHAPAVEYMMPTFGWETAPKGARGFWSKRHGAGLRVYLNGDWVGEDLLGIVLEQTEELKTILKDPSKRSVVPLTIPPERAANEYASAWGLDPKYPGQSIAKQVLNLMNWDFPPEDEFAAGGSGTVQEVGACGWDLQLQEYRGQATEVKVAVVGYKPKYDQALKKWFADVVFDRAPRYGTFVRFAFVRYQPLSREGCEISKVALSDFAKLAVDRTLTIQRATRTVNGKEQHCLAISIWGIPNPSGTNDFEVTLERKHYSKTKTLAWQAVTKQPKGSTSDPDGFNPEVPPPKEQMLWYQEISRDECVDKMLVIREYETITKAIDDGNSGRLLFYADACEV
jgi:hypothetical protein